MHARRPIYPIALLLTCLVTACGEDSPTEPANNVSAPAAPSGLTATPLDGESIRLAWSDNSTIEDGFAVHRCEADSWACVETTAVNIESFVNTGLAPLTTYSYTVVAFNAQGTASADTVEATTTPAGDPPTPPSNPSPVDGAGDQAPIVTLSWTCSDPNGDALVYDVYFGRHPYLFAAEYATTSIDVFDLEFDEEYSWYVVAKDTAGHETTGPTWTFTVRDGGFTVVGSYDYGYMGSDAIEAVVRNGIIYLAHGYFGFDMFDIGSPTAPQFLGRYLVGQHTDRVTGVRVQGSLAYLSYGDLGMHIVDVSVPSSPSLVGKLDYTTYTGAIDLSGGHAYLCRWEDGLLIVDVSTPATPVEAQTYDTPGEAADILVDGTTAFVADGTGGLLVLDLTTPTSPSPLGSAATSAAIYTLTRDGDLIYASGATGVSIIDVGTPSSPVVVGHYPVGGFGPSRVAVLDGVFGHHIFFADSPKMIAVDVADPTTPALAGEYTPPNFTRFPLAAWGYIYFFESDRIAVLSFMP